VLIAAEVSARSEPHDYNPCLDCKLCVAACPVGAISADGHFNFSACFTHNYREFMSGFTNWVESIAASRTPLDYRARVSDSESASMWQSLSFGANYKAAYCMSVCPAGEDAIEPSRHSESARVPLCSRSPVSFGGAGRRASRASSRFAARSGWPQESPYASSSTGRREIGPWPRPIG
jgi:Fe-S-cluster-containing hydrogenase component 2